MNRPKVISKISPSLRGKQGKPHFHSKQGKGKQQCKGQLSVKWTNSDVNVKDFAEETSHIKFANGVFSVIQCPHVPFFKGVLPAVKLCRGQTLIILDNLGQSGGLLQGRSNPKKGTFYPSTTDQS